MKPSHWSTNAIQNSFNVINQNKTLGSLTVQNQIYILNYKESYLERLAEGTPAIELQASSPA